MVVYLRFPFCVSCFLAIFSKTAVNILFQYFHMDRELVRHVSQNRNLDKGGGVAGGYI